MKQLLLLISLLMVSFVIHSQTEEDVEKSDSYVPLSCMTEMIYVEKYEPITSYEIAEAINNRKNTSSLDSTRGKTQILEGANFFNLILYRKINNEVDKIIEKNKDPLVKTVHTRDRKENIDGNYRYLILSDFNVSVFDERSNILAGYYLYDQVTKTRYQSYPTIESLLYAIELARRRKSWADQEYLDSYLARFNRRDFAREYKVQREASPGSVGYVIVISIIIALAILL